MTPHAHNTDAPLHHHRCAIECTVFNTDYSYVAQKTGHNSEGLCFESTSAFRKGTMR